MAKPSGNLLFLWIFKHSIGLLVPLLGAALIVTVCELSVPWLLEQVIDEALSDQVDSDRLNQFGFAMLGIIVVLYFVHHIYLRFEIHLICDTSFQIYRQFYTHLLRQPMSYFKRKKSAEILHRVTNDTNEFEDNVRYLLSDLPYEFMIVIGTLGMMVYLDPLLAGFVFVFLVITSIISARIGRPLPTLERRVQILGARFSNRLQEVIHGIRTVKAYSSETTEQNRLDEANQKRADTQLSSGRVESWLLPVFDLMEILGVVMVVWYGAHLILEKQLTAGGLVAFIAYMEILAVPVSRAGKYYRHWLEASAMAQRIVEFLHDSDEQPNRLSGKANSLKPESVPTVLFDRVTFTYPGASTATLSNISFGVARNEVVALVGRNGAGKSTTMDLLQGFYHPDTGRILAADVDIHAWQPDYWRQQIGVMSQDVFLFNSTIRDNIVYGRPGASDADIALVCQHAGLTPLLESLPKGLMTRVGEKGNKLSGGQRQRIALARLYLTNPSVVIYDEPTAALDGEAAKEVALKIRQFARGRISIIIAHQAEMVAIADRVILFDNGQIVSQGTHAYLMQNETLYQRLFETIEHRSTFDDLSHTLSAKANSRSTSSGNSGR